MQKGVELVGGGSVINGATPSSFQSRDSDRLWQKFLFLSVFGLHLVLQVLITRIFIPFHTCSLLLHFVTIETASDTDHQFRQRGVQWNLGHFLWHWIKGISTVTFTDIKICLLPPASCQTWWHKTWYRGYWILENNPWKFMLHGGPVFPDASRDFSPWCNTEWCWSQLSSGCTGVSIEGIEHAKPPPATFCQQQ